MTRPLDHYRTYLRAELGKLLNLGDGRAFLAASGSLARFGLPGDPTGLAERFSSQHQVDEFVAGLTDDGLVPLTQMCEQWRRNGVADILARSRLSKFTNVPPEQILLRPAETELRERFQSLGWRLVAIAADPLVLASDPYRNHAPGEMVAFPTCLAEPVPGAVGEYSMIDGMHRALQLVRNGEPAIPLCVVEGRAS
jgi:hypothetical protein